LEHYDKQQPHHAACRELAEELLSLGWRECGDKVGAADSVGHTCEDS
jgi:hypothetical protein